MRRASTETERTWHAAGGPIFLKASVSVDAGRGAAEGTVSVRTPPGAFTVEGGGAAFIPPMEEPPLGSHWKKLYAGSALYMPEEQRAIWGLGYGAFSVLVGGLKCG